MEHIQPNLDKQRWNHIEMVIITELLTALEYFDGFH